MLIGKERLSPVACNLPLARRARPGPGLNVRELSHRLGVRIAVAARVASRMMSTTTPGAVTIGV
jgi:hypothetical protein